MPHRPRTDWPRLSGRPATVAPLAAPPRQNATVIRRFFDLIERLERPAQAAPDNKAHPGAGSPERRR